MFLYICANNFARNCRIESIGTPPVLQYDLRRFITACIIQEISIVPRIYISCNNINMNIIMLASFIILLATRSEQSLFSVTISPEQSVNWTFDSPQVDADTLPGTVDGKHGHGHETGHQIQELEEGLGQTASDLNNRGRQR